MDILATLPSSTAEPERVFSSHEISSTLTMTEDRLEACVLLQVHRDILPTLLMLFNTLQKMVQGDSFGLKN